MRLHRALVLAAVGGLLLAACGDDGRPSGGDGGPGDGSTTITFTERVCGYPFPSEMQVEMVAAEFCRCYEDFEYASEAACISGFTTDANEARNMLNADTTVCSCIMDASATHSGAIDDFQRCVAGVYSEFLECFGGAACGSGRQQACGDTADMEAEACAMTTLTGAAQDALDACTP